MKYFIFYRENNNFKDLIEDKNLKKVFSFRIQYLQHLILGEIEVPNDIQSYIVLKYGDDLRNTRDIFIDRTPKPFIDYYPDPNRPDKFKKL